MHSHLFNKSKLNSSKHCINYNGGYKIMKPIDGESYYQEIYYIKIKTKSI